MAKHLKANWKRIGLIGGRYERNRGENMVSNHHVSNHNFYHSETCRSYYLVMALGFVAALGAGSDIPKSFGHRFDERDVR